MAYENGNTHVKYLPQGHSANAGCRGNVILDVHGPLQSISRTYLTVRSWSQLGQLRANLSLLVVLRGRSQSKRSPLFCDDLISGSNLLQIRSEGPLYVAACV